MTRLVEEEAALPTVPQHTPRNARAEIHTQDPKLGTPSLWWRWQRTPPDRGESGASAAGPSCGPQEPIAAREEHASCRVRPAAPDKLAICCCLSSAFVMQIPEPAAGAELQGGGVVLIFFFFPFLAFVVATVSVALKKKKN